MELQSLESRKAPKFDSNAIPLASDHGEGPSRTPQAAEHTTVPGHEVGHTRKWVTFGLEDRMCVLDRIFLYIPQKVSISNSSPFFLRCYTRYSSGSTAICV